MKPVRPMANVQWGIWSSRSRRVGRAMAVLLATSGAWACSGSPDGSPNAAGNGGQGISGNGGSGDAARGGGGSGGAAASGGVAGAGGTTGSGGAAGSGGAGGSGGIGASGGSAGSAGVSGAAGVAGGSGGLAGSGGTAGSAGTAGSGGTAGSAGSTGADAATGSDGAGKGGTETGTDAPAGRVVFGRNVRVNDDTGTGRQTEVALASGPGLLIAGWMDERSQRVCAFSVSTDGGVTWGRNVSIPLTTGSFVGDPSVTIDGGGTLYAVCQEYGLNQIRMMTSTDRGVTWSAVRSIQSAPDKPWVGGGTIDGMVFVSWLGNSAGIKRSLDRGLTWGMTQPLGNIIHGTAIVTSTTGLVHVPYNLDSDNNQLRYLRSRDNGVTYDAARDLLPDMGTFCFNCNPRQHPIVGAASDPTGKFVAITWTSVMPGGQSDDDVWLLYSKDSGDTWTRPLRVNDNTTASRQFESWVAVDNYGRVHVAWTDLRNGQNETWYARSADPTTGFEPNLQVTDGRGSANTNFLGDYKGIVVQGPDVIVVWQDTRTDSGDIYAARAPGAAGP